MSREQMRFVIALAAIVLLGVIGYHMSATIRAQKESEGKFQEYVKEVVPDAAQRMQNFRRAKIRDGKKVWEIVSNQARYIEEKGEIFVDSPDVTLYLKDGEILTLRCREGHVYMKEGNQEVTRMELAGDVEMHLGDYSVKTSTAVYESEGNTISSPDSIQITGRGLSVEGQGYHVDVDEKRLTLIADVRTTVVKDNG
jgi:LPS export ABC transporter protein LptC